MPSGTVVDEPGLYGDPLPYRNGLAVAFTLRTQSAQRPDSGKCTRSSVMWVRSATFRENDLTSVESNSTVLPHTTQVTGTVVDPRRR